MKSERDGVYSHLLLCLCFGIAMGLLEAIVVVYLRTLHCPEGFAFPLVSIAPQILSTEFLRELVTIVMIAIVAIIAGRNYLQKFAYFLAIFGVWDIAYYLFLRVFLDWPPSILTWDVLFLIPLPWVAPVLAPLICAVMMILMSLSMLFLQSRGYRVAIGFAEWVLLLVGVAIVMATFVWDFTAIALGNGLLSQLGSLAENELFRDHAAEYQPSYYNWLLFACGQIFIVGGIGSVVNRARARGRGGRIA